MQHAWIRFAREGRPGPERLPPWPRYQLSDRATVLLGRQCAVAEAPFEAERDVLAGWGL